MSSVGAHLRELRERRGVSLEEISRSTRVARSYLEALEAGDFTQLPAPVFTRGFIRAYCQVLGESPDEALGRFNELERESSEEAPRPYERHPRAQPRTRGSVMVSFVLLVVLGIALLAVTLTLRSGREASRQPSVATVEPRAGDAARGAETVPPTVTAPESPANVPATDRPAAPSGGAPGTGAPPSTATTPSTGTTPRADAPPTGGTPPTGVTSPTAPAPGTVPASGTTAPSAGTSPRVAPPTTEAPSTTGTAPRPTEPASTAAPAATGPTNAREVERAAASAAAPYRLIARTTEATWLRVRTEDGRQLTEETIPPGQIREWVSNRRLTVVVGNAGGVKLELNGVALPSLGPSRAVVELSLPPQAQ